MYVRLDILFSPSLSPPTNSIPERQGDKRVEWLIGLITAMPELSEMTLDLSGTEVTDAGIQSLIQHLPTSLQQLTLGMFGTKVTFEKQSLRVEPTSPRFVMDSGGPLRTLGDPKKG